MESLEELQKHFDEVKKSVHLSENTWYNHGHPKLSEKEQAKKNAEDFDYLYRGIIENYAEFEEINLEGNTITVKFYENLKIEFIAMGECYIYVNDMFCCGIKEEDLEEVMGYIFDGLFVFCKIKNPYRGRGQSPYRVIVEEMDNYHDSKDYINVWSIEEVIK